ncbi:ankyrin repeat-containing protein [Pyrus ussuriensis x Pyrus communis]|uniref:Ankyrin repeat-containing protein n=1 Tax=Pyrus ussuriensis x Pyrus communis TaxID=2448454 RepID=A0A5N5GHQ0_9ROSA|nr:ankyrin repeat-containing protein [Pyrus ussuriensis x Pyrus communis]
MVKVITLKGINRIYKMKLMHEQVQQFLPLMCKASKEILTAKKGSTGYYKRKKLEEALLVAVEQGHVEYITHFFEDFSYPVHYTNDKRQSLYQIAAECRHHKVYNLIYALSHSDRIQEIVGTKDKFGNNMLHTVASITPLSQIYHIQGAALQMQRELQWFKEVESVANPKDCEAVNKKNMTPREVFIENHKEMWKEAENSMKETATSCTVVGALIVTIMFAAVFTVPGGNNGDTGLPTFLTKKVFIAFVFSDAISLFSSTTSIIMFLGILTSRYSQDDFYKSLPTKMMIGLFTLLLSIVSMMIVFSCALYIMLDGKLSIVIASILIASVPVTSFIWIQFPLLVDIFISTYGPRMFGENKTTWFRFLCDL